MLTETAGDLIRNELEHFGLTQRTAAVEIGISQAHLNDLLTGRRGITTAMALRFEKFIGIKATDLLSAQTSAKLKVEKHLAKGSRGKKSRNVRAAKRKA